MMTRPSLRGVLTSVVIFAPLIVFADTPASAMSFKELVDGPIKVLGNQIIGLLYGLAFLAFLIGMVRFFFSHEAEGRQKGKMFAIYSLIGLVVLFSVWGFVRVLLGILASANT
jgi:hypothetical protein